MSEKPEELSSQHLAAILNKNIHTIIDHRLKDAANLSWQDRAALKVTRFVGTIKFVFLHILFFGIWGFCNFGILPCVKFDPDFNFFDAMISVETIILTVFVLINQNRMVKVDAQRADLNLQVSLLAEHELTHLIHMITAIANKMHLEIDELKQEIQPEEILKEIENREKELRTN